MNSYCLLKILQSLEDRPNEEGGAILVQSCGERLIPLKLQNISSNKISEFKFSFEELYKKMEENQQKEIAYFWHTHPREETSLVFSDADKSFQEMWCIPQILVAPDTKKINSYFPKSRKIRELSQRKYLLGYNDCISLVKDYFEKQNVNFPFFFITQKEEINSKFLEFVSGQYDFKEIQISEIDKNCIIINMQGGIFKHIQVYLGENNILHQRFGETSCIENIYESKILSSDYKILKHK